MKDYSKGFSRGYGQLRLADRDEARQKIMAALGIKAVSHFYLYKNGGRPNISAASAQAVEQVFSEYGITDVWGA